MPTPTTTRTGTPTATAATVLSAGQLDTFFTAATRADKQLRTAATLVNSGIGSTQIVIAPFTVTAVKTVDIHAVGRAIPAGLPTELLQATFTVYTDLSTRRAAFNRVTDLDEQSPLPQGSPDATYLIRCLGNGNAPARWFPTDLAAVRSLAAATPAITPAPENSRASAEVAIQVHAIAVMNNGCDQCGVQTQRPISLLPIEWKKITISDSTWDGTIGAEEAALPFTARYTAAQGWQVDLLAC